MISRSGKARSGVSAEERCLVRAAVKETLVRGVLPSEENSPTGVLFHH